MIEDEELDEEFEEIEVTAFGDPHRQVVIVPSIANKIGIAMGTAAIWPWNAEQNKYEEPVDPFKIAIARVLAEPEIAHIREENLKLHQEIIELRKKNRNIASIALVFCPLAFIFIRVVLG